MAITEYELRRFLDEKVASIASVLMAYYNCCGIQGSACKAGDPNPCCINSQYGAGACPFWQEEKCQFVNSDCKLWLCETAMKTTDPKCLEALRLLQQFGMLFEIVRPPLNGDGYVGADKQSQ